MKATMAETAQVEFTPAMLATCIGEGLAAVCREVFEGSLQSVILTGSTARNEVSYTCQDGRATLLSDVEAIVVLQDHAPLPPRQKNAMVCRSIEHWLSEHGVMVHVGLSIVHSGYLEKLPAHIFSYELRACGVVVCGERSILERIPAYASTELSMEDAWRLLTNRLIEQMEVADQPSASEALRYRSVKLCLDLAASLLIFFGRFEAGYGNRLQRMEEFALSAEAAHLPFSIGELLPLLRQSTAAKLQPDAFAELGENFAEQVASLGWRAWIWQLQRMSGCNDGATADEMIRVFSRRQGLEKLLRGWLYVARRTGWTASLRHLPKWLALFAQGLTPRHAIYLAAYKLPRVDGQTPLGDLLPRAEALPNAASVAQICWNYQEFVTETRA